MFGIGGSEILVILVVALLFLGPDKLPDAAKTISKGIRDLKKQSRALQNQIESDEQIGGAIRDLKSALRGEEAPIRPPVRKEPPPGDRGLAPKEVEAARETLDEADAPMLDAQHVVTLPETAGEAEVKDEVAAGELASLIKPAPGTVAKTPVTEPTGDEPKQKHG